MPELNVVFSLNNNNITIKCSKHDKMKSICEQYSSKINHNLNSLLFIYERYQLNFDLNIQDQINSIDDKNNSMKIFVYENNTNKKLISKIKSLYFIEKIFSHIDEQVKLKIIKHNKALQNILHIKLLNYQFYSNKYIIYQQNKKGKEYDYNNEITFEGEYLNGERNGIGKEYYTNGKIKFEGEYLNNKKHGKGKEYDYHNKLIFEGEYKRGYKYNGKGYDGVNNKYIYEIQKGNGMIKDFYYNAKIKFEGELLNGKKNGNGKEYHANSNIKFEGYYLNNKKHGI